jgi:hypothetical protein
VPGVGTVLHNVVVVHNHTPVIGAIACRAVGKYRPHGHRSPILPQDHRNRVRFRNIWVRKLHDYEQLASPGQPLPRN